MFKYSQFLYLFRVFSAEQIHLASENRLNIHAYEHRCSCYFFITMYYCYVLLCTKAWTSDNSTNAPLSSTFFYIYKGSHLYIDAHVVEQNIQLVHIIHFIFV